LVAGFRGVEGRKPGEVKASAKNKADSLSKKAGKNEEKSPV